MPATKSPPRSPTGKGKALPLDPEAALGSVGWYVKRVYETLSDRVFRLEDEVRKMRLKSPSR